MQIVLIYYTKVWLQSKQTKYKEYENKIQNLTRSLVPWIYSEKVSESTPDMATWVRLGCDGSKEGLDAAAVSGAAFEVDSLEIKAS